MRPKKSSSSCNSIFTRPYTDEPHGRVRSRAGLAHLSLLDGSSITKRLCERLSEESSAARSSTRKELLNIQ